MQGNRKVNNISVGTDINANLGNMSGPMDGGLLDGGTGIKNQRDTVRMVMMKYGDK